MEQTHTTPADPKPTWLVKFGRPKQEKHTKSGKPYGDLIRRSHCGLWKIVRREWVLPYTHTSYELHLLDTNGNHIGSDKDIDSLREAREGADDNTRNARENFGEGSKEAARIEAVWPNPSKGTDNG